jgi:hypothetical protein
MMILIGDKIKFACYLSHIKGRQAKLNEYLPEKVPHMESYGTDSLSLLAEA